MRAVDTNVLVRLLSPAADDQTELAEAFIERGAWVSHLVLAETIWVLDSVYELKADRLAEGIEMLLNHRDLTVQDADVVAEALELFRTRPVLGFSDCLVLEIARKAGHLPLGTFDRELSKLDGAELVRATNRPRQKRKR
jgi:predicted nucleic-acid-binding protein